ncbi:MAG: hypothetical protein AAGF35_12405 [Pseudomonadota bacterium]
MDATSAAMLTFGVAALMISWVLLLIESWREDFTWGLCTLILPPLSYLYGLSRWNIAGNAILLAVVGCLLLLLA